MLRVYNDLISYATYSPNVYALPQVTLEEQMICGALQTLNEEAFEDVASNEMTGVAPGETLSQQLAPIREGSEFSSSVDSGLSVPAFHNSNSSNNNSFLRGAGVRGGGLSGNNLLLLGQTKANTNFLGGGGPSSASLVDYEGGAGESSLNIAALQVEQQQQELQPPQHKDATIIVMSQSFAQNKSIDDTSV